MKQGYTHITCVIDKSGSMQKTTKDTIGGFDAYMEKQKAAPGTCLVDLVLFNDKDEIIYEGQDIHTIPSLEKSYWASGNTALHDAMGKTIHSLGLRLSKLPEEERPEKIIFITITDGEENCSKEFTGRLVNDLTKHQSDVYKWEFVYIGANQDAIAVGGSIGVAKANSLNYRQDSKGIGNMFNSLGNNTLAYRSGDARSMAFTEEDVKAQTMGTL